MVAPYYSRPPQDALEAHFREVADASGLPVMLYDIPGRTGIRIEPDTLVLPRRAPADRRRQGLRRYDLLGTQKVLSRTGLAYYAGCDGADLLALYAVGAAGTSAPPPTSCRTCSGPSSTPSTRATPDGPPCSSGGPCRSSSR
ncbi:4-hydroxy-tetrahydrodipicolinate synthase [Streptomyces violaceorubidus]